jgi:hypothetical protein
MDDDVDLSRYEEADPDHPTEEETLDRANRRLDKTLGKLTEVEERMARNAGRRSD